MCGKVNKLKRNGRVTLYKDQRTRSRCRTSRFISCNVKRRTSPIKHVTGQAIHPSGELSCGRQGSTSLPSSKSTKTKKRKGLFEWPSKLTTQMQVTFDQDRMRGHIIWFIVRGLISTEKQPLNSNKCKSSSYTASQGSSYYNVGARSKEPKLSPAKAKRVHWDDNVGNDTEYIEYRAKLQSVDIAEFQNSVSLRAVQFLLDENNSRDQNLIQLAVKLLKVEKGQYPDGRDLIKVIEDCNFNEKSIVTAFIDFCKTQRGADALNNLVETTQNKGNQIPVYNDTTSIETLGSDEQPMENSSQGLEMYEQRQVTELSYSVEKLALNNQAESQVTQVTNGREPTKGADYKNQMEKEQSLRLLKKENELLQNSLNCIHCTISPKEITSLPCGHFNFCAECTNFYCNCPVCGQVILSEVKTFLG